MVHTGMTIATHLQVKAGLLQIPHQRQTTSDGVRLALPKHFLRGGVQVLEGRGVEIAGNALQKERSTIYIYSK